jgi:nucleotidyltransferase substrate binding protein (TIGR01987 family)
VEKLKNKYVNLVNIATKLSRSIHKYSNPPTYADEEDIESYMTTLIKRFELTFESLWKYLKYSLKDSYAIDTLGSKDVIRKSFEVSLITQEENKILLDIVEARNEIAHNYDYYTAIDLSKTIIKEYYPTIKIIIVRLNKANN